MKKLTTALAAILLAGAAHASGGSVTSGAFSASGFASLGQPGNWQVGAMNESYGFASIRPTCSKCGTGVEISTSGGSTSEGFGSNFRGMTGAAGVGFGFGHGGAGFRGRF